MSAINKGLGGYARSRVIAKRPDLEYKSEVTIWRDRAGVRKIEALDRDDSGNVITEYYYLDGALVFAYQAIKGYNDTGKRVIRGEERQYFNNGKMSKWLSGLDKVANVIASAEFDAESKTKLTTSMFFLQAVAKGDAASIVTAQPAGATTVKVRKFTKQTSGTLSNMEMGDLACYLTLMGGKGKAFVEIGDFDLHRANESDRQAGDARLRLRKRVG